MAIRVKPGASRTKVGGVYGAHGALVVAVQERAADGRATEAALKAFAAALGVPRRAISLVAGATSRDKVFAVARPAVDLAAHLDRLRAL